MKEGYWIGFCCPKCGSYMFGSSLTGGVLMRHCHGNEQWRCDYSAPESDDSKHFREFIPYLPQWEAGQDIRMLSAGSGQVNVSESNKIDGCDKPPTKGTSP